MKTTSETIANAVEWVEQTPPQTPPIRTNIVEALIKALSLGEVSANFRQSQSSVDFNFCRLTIFTCSPMATQA